MVASLINKLDKQTAGGDWLSAITGFSEAQARRNYRHRDAVFGRSPADCQETALCLVAAATTGPVGTGWRRTCTRALYEAPPGFL